MSSRTASGRHLIVSASSVAILTLGQLFLWPNHDAHRSLLSLVMTLVWAAAITVLLVLVDAEHRSSRRANRK